MRKAALYVQGRIVVGDSHLDAYLKLNDEEKNTVVSGFFDPETQEFLSDLAQDHFFDKELLLVRHATSEDPNEPDAGISEDGSFQAKQLAFLLQTFDLKDFSGIVSPLLRCLQTALVVHETLHIDFQIDPEIMETPCFLDSEENYRVQNYSSQFPQFNWPSSDDWILTHETQHEFMLRTKHALQHFSQRCIVVTHCGIIFNLAKLALCDQKVQVLKDRGIPPASVTHIDRREIRCIGRTHAEICED